MRTFMNGQERNKSLVHGDGLDLQEYFDLFVQRIPRYVVKSKRSSTWKSKNKPLKNLPVIAHLTGKYSVGVLGKWYPEYAILDIDNRSFDEVKEIREKLNLDETNSMLYRSESPDSYHILIRPFYKQKPPTLKLLRDIFKPFGQQHGIEIYPQEKRTIRLPFGKFQEFIDYEYIGLKTWKTKLWWFEKLDEFDLKGIPYSQGFLDFSLPKQRLPIVKEAQELLQHGLQYEGTREQSQFILLYYFFRKNTPKHQAVLLVQNWIRYKNNGLSKDFKRNPYYVYNHIKIQADIIYSQYELSKTYPDETHNRFYGYLTKPDLQSIIEVSKGSKPRMRFLFNLVKYAYPRRHRTFIDIHSDKLISWSSKRTYLKRLDELESKGLIKRFQTYRKGEFSKSIQIDWNFKANEDAVLLDGRSVNTLEYSLKLCFKPDELKQLLEKQGLSRPLVYYLVMDIYSNPEYTREFKERIKRQDLK